MQLIGLTIGTTQHSNVLAGKIVVVQVQITKRNTFTTWSILPAHGLLLIRCLLFASHHRLTQRLPLLSVPLREPPHTHPCTHRACQPNASILRNKITSRVDAGFVTDENYYSWIPVTWLSCTFRAISFVARWCSRSVGFRWIVHDWNTESH